MLKRSRIFLTAFLGVIMLLLGCSKSGHNTIAFVGDESDVKHYYQVYPELYFPPSISQNLKDGLFPPDLTGEYEVIHPTYDGTYEYYDQITHSYIPYPAPVYTSLSRRSMYIIIENQVNGMARIKFAFKQNDNFDYVDWYDECAYIYGNIYSDNKKEFMLCYENTELAGDANYYRGNIIKGTVDEQGIHNINIWSIVKDRSFEEEFPGLLNQYGFEHAVHNLAIRKN